MKVRFLAAVPEFICVNDHTVHGAFLKGEIAELCRLEVEKVLLPKKRVEVIP